MSSLDPGNIGTEVLDKLKIRIKNMDVLEKSFYPFVTEGVLHRPQGTLNFLTAREMNKFGEPVRKSRRKRCTQISPYPSENSNNES